MRTLYLLLSLFLILASAGEVSAFEFAPFRVKFDPSGAGASQLFTVKNNTGQPVSVQIRATTREMGRDGSEKDDDAEKDFTIYPAQMVLKPHAQRSVRIQWMGDPNIKQEKAYRIVAEQLPVNLDKERPKHSAVKFLVDYRAALFVTPSGVKPDVTLDSFSMARTPASKRLELVFSNRGAQHALLRNLKLEMKDNRGNAVTLSDEQLKGIIGETILADHRREVFIPWPAALTGLPQHIDFTYDKQAF